MSKSIKKYLLITFAISWLLMIAGSLMYLKGNEVVYKIALVLVMYVPLFAILLAKIPVSQVKWKLKIKGHWKYLFMSLWAPGILSTLGALLFFLIFRNAFDPQYTTLKKLLGSAGMKQLNASHMSMEMYLLITILQSMLYLPFMNMMAAIGEEAGWRGVLYPALKNAYGTAKGRLFGGLIWGIWHFPIMIIAGYEYGKTYLGAPVLGPLVFCLFTISFGILLDYVYEKTDCIWFPALMHGALNAFTLFSYMVKPSYAQMSILGPGQIGLIGMIPFLTTAFLIMKRSGDRL